MKNVISQCSKVGLSLLLFFGVYERVFAQETAKVTNPLSVDNVGEFLLEILDVITILSVPVIAIMIIIAGFQFVTAGGDEEQLEDAKKTALYVVIGAAIILGAELIVTVLQNTASSIGVGGFD